MLGFEICRPTSMRRALLYIIGIAFITGCTETKKSESKSIYVSILPLKGIVEQIVGEDYPIHVLVPAGASPESFEPTARQLIELSDADIVMGVGALDFEKSMLERLGEEREIVNLSKGIEFIAGSCSHSHCNHEHHAHGIDPHIWTSPRELKTIARNAFNAIERLHPDSTHYRVNFDSLITRIEECDSSIMAQLSLNSVKSFYIYHPAMSYYARAYNIEQVAIEHEGKEPSVRRIGELISRGREEGIRNIFYQSQFPASSVEIIAKDLNGNAISFKPLEEDIIAEIKRFTNLLCEHNSNQ